MNDASVAACLIVRDGAATVGNAIASVRPFVDEVCVVLAGASADGTQDVIEALASLPGPPIRVDAMPWPGSFAVAREASFAMSGAKWRFMIDDDERLQGGGNLRRILAATPDHVAALWCRVHTLYDSGDGLGWLMRFARAASPARWEGAVHERLAGLEDVGVGVISPRELRVDHRRVFTRKGRHDYQKAVKDAVEAGNTRLCLQLAQHLLVDDGDAAGAAAMVERYLYGRDGFDNVYADGLETLVAARLALGDRDGAAKAWTDRLAYLSDWRRAANAGELKGPAAGMVAMERFDADDFALVGTAELDRFLARRGLARRAVA